MKVNQGWKLLAVVSTGLLLITGCDDNSEPLIVDAYEPCPENGEDASWVDFSVYDFRDPEPGSGWADLAVGGASVRLEGTGKLEYIATKKSNERGGVVFCDVPPGTYTVVVALDGVEQTDTIEARKKSPFLGSLFFGYFQLRPATTDRAF